MPDPSDKSDGDRLGQQQQQANEQEAKKRQEQEAAEDAQEKSDEKLSIAPAGTGEYVIKEGDCISSIAVETGHFWEKLWKHSSNSQLKSARQNPNVLMPDDRLHVPELERKEEPGATEMLHRFRRKGEPSYVRIVVMQGDLPRANQEYVLEIDGELTNGTSTSEGEIFIPIRGNARGGKLTIGPDQEEFQIKLGGVGPIDDLTGVQQRLNNLYYDAGAVDGVLGPKTEQALKLFQEKNGLTETGKPDSQTRAKLLEVHGC